MGLSVSIVLAQHLFAQDTRTRPRSTLAWVQDFLSGVYPETRAYFAQLTVVAEQPWDGVVRHVRYAALKYGEPPLPPGLSARELMARSTLNASFDFDAEGSLQRASIHGALVNQLALSDLYAELNRRLPTEDELAPLLRSLNVRFGPWAKADLLRVVDLQRLQPLLGAFTTEHVRFSARAGEEGDYLPLWEIRVVQGERPYDIYVEPIGGRIVGITARSPQGDRPR